ncbi:MAG: AAA family ATPase, partial [bacterium]
MHLITIGREFGSGGREVGKRLAGLLGWDYYDREVLAALAGESALSERYVERALENGAWRGVPLTFRRSFRLTAPPAGAGLLSGERRIIEGVAALGRDAVIVGRSADVLLAEYRPLRLFLRADAAAKLRRCRERAEPGAAPTDAEILRAMRRIDRSRREN